MADRVLASNENGCAFSTVEHDGKPALRITAFPGNYYDLSVEGARLQAEVLLAWVREQEGK